MLSSSSPADEGNLYKYWLGPDGYLCTQSKTAEKTHAWKLRAFMHTTYYQRADIYLRKLVEICVFVFEEKREQIFTKCMQKKLNKNFCGFSLWIWICSEFFGSRILIEQKIVASWWRTVESLLFSKFCYIFLTRNTG